MVCRIEGGGAEQKSKGAEIVDQVVKMITARVGALPNDLKDGDRSEMFVLTETELSAVLRDALEALAVDAAAYRWLITNARWIRHEHEAYVAGPVPRGANLSCSALRDYAVKVVAGVADVAADWTEPGADQGAGGGVCSRDYAPTVPREQGWRL